MSLGSLWGAAASVALVAGVSLVSILQVDDWAESLHWLDTIFPPTSILQMVPGICAACCIRPQ